MADFRDLQDYYPGSDIWVIGSGPSAGFIDPEFFINKIALGVNYAWQNFPVNYTVLKEQYAITDAVQDGEAVVASRWHCGDKNSYENIADAAGEVYWFEHPHNQLDVIDLEPVGNEAKLGLVVSYSTITSAIHLAAWMGAKNILLVGHDCGTVDGELKMRGYNKPEFQKVYPSFYRDFVGKIEPQTLQLRERLGAVYGTRIYSLNPWVNLGMEGHVYERV